MTQKTVTRAPLEAFHRHGVRSPLIPRPLMLVLLTMLLGLRLRLAGSSLPQKQGPRLRRPLQGKRDDSWLLMPPWLMWRAKLP